MLDWLSSVWTVGFIIDLITPALAEDERCIHQRSSKVFIPRPSSVPFRIICKKKKKKSPKSILWEEAILVWMPAHICKVVSVTFRYAVLYPVGFWKNTSFGKPWLVQRWPWMAAEESRVPMQQQACGFVPGSGSSLSQRGFRRARSESPGRSRAGGLTLHRICPQ